MLLADDRPDSAERRREVEHPVEPVAEQQALTIERERLTSFAAPVKDRRQLAQRLHPPALVVELAEHCETALVELDGARGVAARVRRRAEVDQRPGCAAAIPDLAVDRPG